MRYVLLGAAALVLAGLAPLVAPANAAEYRYCASGVRGAGGCMFATREQCNAFVSGAGGSCSTNPRYPSNAYARAARPRR